MVTGRLPVFSLQISMLPYRCYDAKAREFILPKIVVISYPSPPEGEFLTR